MIRSIIKVGQTVILERMHGEWSVPAKVIGVCDDAVNVLTHGGNTLFVRVWEIVEVLP